MAEPDLRFVHRNPDLPDFWNERFAQRFTPWDQGEVPVELHDFVARSAAPLSTLIPGCGVGHEVPYLAAAGWPVVAIDFSATAVRVAQAMVHAYADRILQADFFSFVPPSPIQFIYERAFLCALPRTRWPEVAARWAQLLPADALLGGFFFFDAKESGPPFGAERPALDALMTPYFELLEDWPAEQSIAVFAGRERWLLWRRRDTVWPFDRLRANGEEGCLSKIAT